MNQYDKEMTALLQKKKLDWSIKFVEGHMERDGEILSAQEETRVFKALKLPWIEPELRTTTTLRYVLAK